MRPHPPSPLPEEGGDCVPFGKYMSPPRKPSLRSVLPSRGKKLLGRPGEFLERIHANGIDIHYEISGSGPVVLLAHSLGSDHSIWGAQKSALAGRRTVIAYDLRGHGQTTVTTGAYDFGLLADDALELMAALKIERVSFVGISLGGMIGRALALRAPERLEKLVLADPTCRISNRRMPSTACCGSSSASSLLRSGAKRSGSGQRRGGEAVLPSPPEPRCRRSAVTIV